MQLPRTNKVDRNNSRFFKQFLFFSSAFILKGVALNSLRFLFDGQRINDDQTPKDVSFYLHVVNLMFW